MSSVLVDRIGQLVTNDPTLGDGSQLGLVTDAALVVDGEQVAWVGRARDAPDADARLDAAGRVVIPGFVDSHTHLVFAGDRAEEYTARMSGTPYSAGGIATTVAATRAATDEQLSATTARLLGEMSRQGTTTVEIKSGYGLSAYDEARCLAVAARFTAEATYLGAHVVPAEFAGRADAYVALVTGEMLAAAAPYARWVLHAHDPATEINGQPVGYCADFRGSDYCHLDHTDFRDRQHADVPDRCELARVQFPKCVAAGRADAERGQCMFDRGGNVLHEVAEGCRQSVRGRGNRQQRYYSV